MSSHDPLLPIDEVAERLTISVSSLRRAISNGKFPAPMVLGTVSQRWRESTVDQYLEDQARAAEEATAERRKAGAAA